MGLNLPTILQNSSLHDCLLPYVTYLFSFQNLAHSTITTYLAGLQHHLHINDHPVSVWFPALHQCLKGFQKIEYAVTPLSQRIKLPFTLSLIFSCDHHFLSQHPDPFARASLLAALVVGFMFLFRKSEFLTAANRKPKVSDNVIATLLAANVHFWYGTTAFAASDGLRIPAICPEMVSIYIPRSKGDPFGKGATRFFPSDPNNIRCVVSIFHRYACEAALSPHDCIFAGPRFVVTGSMISHLIKLTAFVSGMPTNRFSPHSLRVGGLVTLFAADVPDSLKQLAGRWASPKSFVVYARATMQQFNHIATALNDPSFVTADHIRMFYQN